jgi:hypothetical protein
MSYTSVTKNLFPEIYHQYLRYHALYNSTSSKFPLYNFPLSIKIQLVTIFEEFLRNKDLDFKIKFTVNTKDNNYKLISDSVYCPLFRSITEEIKRIASEQK